MMCIDARCRAGYAQRDITPDFPTELVGGYRPEPVTCDVRGALCVQALALENVRGRYCVMTFDSLGLTRALAREMAETVAQALDTAPERVMLLCSHTHSAPDPRSSVHGERYRALLFSRAAECARAALAGARPARAGWALTECGIGENRREGCTAVDRRLAALKFQDAQTGASIAALVRVTAHANILMREARVSADFFAPARERLAEVLACPVLLAQGAAGNVKPVGVDKISGGNMADAERVAGMLADAAKALRFDMREITRVDLYERALLHECAVPGEREAEAIAAAARAECGADGTQWLAECARLRAAGVALQTISSPMRFFFLNEGCLCGVADEIFCEIAMDAAKCAGSPLLLLSGYTTGCAGYLATDEELAKGGFEPVYSYLFFFSAHGHVAHFSRGAAERVSRLAVREFLEHA